MGIEQQQRPPSPQHLTAHHEAGHALVAFLLNDHIEFVTAHPRADADPHAMGLVRTIHWLDPHDLLRTHLAADDRSIRRIGGMLALCRIRFCLAGYAAESLLEGGYLPCGYDDFDQMWDCATLENDGDMLGADDFAAAAFGRRRAIDVLATQYDAVRALLARHWRPVASLAVELLARDVVRGDELDAFFGPIFDDPTSVNAVLQPEFPRIGRARVYALHRPLLAEHTAIAGDAS